MSVRKCELDQSQAKYACTTHNAYYCEQHFKLHISDRKPHIAFAIENELTQLEFEKLVTELMKRIGELERSKKQILKQTAQIVAKIEEACIESFKNLNQLIQSYRTYTIENNFDNKTFKKIKKILSTRLEIQIDQDLTLKVTEEPIIEERKRSITRETNIEAIRKPIEFPKRESNKEPNRETSNKHQAKRPSSNLILREYTEPQ
jgi:hypothetical protein